MKLFRSFLPLWLSLFLFLVYIIVDKNINSVLFNWKSISSEGYAYDLESLREHFSYSAENIFDPGYVRETDFALYGRVFVLPQNNPLSGQGLLVPAESGEAVIKINLPDGFKSGALSLRISSKSKYVIATSFDLKEWRSEEFPGFSNLVYNVIRFEDNKINNKLAYVKFIPGEGEGLEINFNVFQYVSSIQPKKADYGYLFYPETDIDYEGNQVIQQGIIYDARKDKTTN